MKKQKRKIFFSIGGNGSTDLGQKTGGGRFTKRTRGMKPKLANL